MIRRAIQECPGSRLLLREENDDFTRRSNRIIRFRNSIVHIPYQVSQIVKTVRLNHDIQRTCKRILVKNHVPLDVFTHLQSYLYEFDFTHTRLPSRGFSRAVHHLIRIERVRDVPQALAVGKYFDDIRVECTRESLLREFRDALWPFMCQGRVWNIGDARPEFWYLQESFAIGYI